MILFYVNLVFAFLNSMFAMSQAEAGNKPQAFLHILVGTLCWAGALHTYLQHLKAEANKEDKKDEKQGN